MNNTIFVNNKEYEIITYIPIESGNFVVYTDGKQLENGQVALYVNRISLDNNEILFDDLDNNDVIKVIIELKERLVSNE